MASPHGVSTGTPNTSSFMKSVKSSWATWIHHSCGSLMTIQMNAASPASWRCDSRRGSHFRRMASYAMKKYSKVFGKSISSQRSSVSSKATTPTSR